MVKVYIILGALGLFFGFANPIFHIEFSVLLYPIALYLIARESTQVFRDAWLCGLIGVSLSMYFIYNAVHIYGHFPWIFSVACTVVIGAYIGAWGGLFAYMLNKVLNLSLPLRVVFAGLLFYILEWLRSYFLTGFPWNSLSSAFAPLPEFIQLASLVGAFGLSGIYVSIAILLAEGFRFFWEERVGKITNKMFCYGGLSIVSALFLLGGIFIFGQSRLAESYSKGGFFHGLVQEEPFIVKEKITNQINSQSTENLDNYFAYYSNPSLVGAARHLYLQPNFESIQEGGKKFFNQNLLLFSMIQGNISQAIKWDKKFQEASVYKYIRLSHESLNFLKLFIPAQAMKIPQVFLFPETALPFFWGRDVFLTSALLDFGEDKNLLFGAPAYKGLEEEGDKKEKYEYYNRLHLLQNNKLSFYDKRRLVPFGEFLPKLPFIPEFFENLLQGIGGFSAGEYNQMLSFIDYDETENERKYKVSGLICYEAIFPHLAQNDIDNGAEIFINISNDAWYDKSSAADQHLHLSLMRAVEQKRFLVRAGNTGISAIVDDYGRILAKTPLFEDASLSSFVPLRQDKTMFYYIYPYLPYMALILLFLLFYCGRKIKI